MYGTAPLRFLLWLIVWVPLAALGLYYTLVTDA